jgi:hypothetical protein
LPNRVSADGVEAASMDGLEYLRLQWGPATDTSTCGNRFDDATS